jgi:hypothetical protein
MFHVQFVLYQVPTKPNQGESMSTMIVNAWFYLVSVVVCIPLVNIYKICLKLKSGLRMTHIFFKKDYLYHVASSCDSCTLVLFILTVKGVIMKNTARNDGFHLR